MLSHARKHSPILEEGTFLMDEHFSNAEKAVDYATANGTATIVDKTGRTIWVLSMLTADLPELLL